MNLDVDPQLDLSRVLRVVSRERSSLGSIPGITKFIEIIHHWILTRVVDIWVRFPVSMNLDVDPQLDLSRVLRVVSRERSSLGSIPGIIKFIEIIHHWNLTGVVDLMWDVDLDL